MNSPGVAGLRGGLGGKPLASRCAFVYTVVGVLGGRSRFSLALEGVSMFRLLFSTKVLGTKSMFALETGGGSARAVETAATIKETTIVLKEGMFREGSGMNLGISVLR